VRVDLHDGERPAQRVEQPASHAGADRVFAAQPDDQLAAARRAGDRRADDGDGGAGVVRQVERGQRVHAVTQRRLQVELAVVEFHLLRGGDDRVGASGGAAAVAHRRLERDRQHQHAGAVEVR
jgi:hypothetical protein